MPIQLAPNTTPADASGAFAILAIIADEGKFKTRLQQLADQAKSLDGMIENSKRMDAESKQRMQDAEKRHADLDRREVSVNQREAAAANAKNEYTILRQRLFDKEASFDADMAKRHGAKEAELKRQQNELNGFEKTLKEAQREFDEERAKHKADVANAHRVLDARTSEVSVLEAQVKRSIADLETEKAKHQARIEKFDALRTAMNAA